MVAVDWKTDRRAGVTFVTATVSNTRTTPQTIRLESQLDGPTWPPRHDGIRAPEWSDDIWEGTVESNRCRGVGFASPAPPTEPPLEVLAVSRVSDARTATADEVLATLDGWAPTPDILTPGP
ncbi:hypothetical protein GS429_14605 [Natronorubrum sp. JWXQ-INN-674]|uniref:Uncharacterized protein n=1 Tax=Natronorubrum halalkaliphilum TaxID=2691917 RepID=A0A6B0VP35_9EURY|nr:hypothetical protein [Natronorubrum halalkaliphilum]MXV63274.1 hypothetical protein [Natronorubrum halalkaliphilum]